MRTELSVILFTRTKVSVNSFNSYFIQAFTSTSFYKTSKRKKLLEKAHPEVLLPGSPFSPQSFFPEVPLLRSLSSGRAGDLFKYRQHAILFLVQKSADYGNDRWESDYGYQSKNR